MTRLLSCASLVLLIVLAACSAEATNSPGGASPSGPSPTEAGTPMATASASASAEPSEQTSGSSDFTWTEAGRFADDGWIQLVNDVTAWDGGFLAIGHRWQGEFVVGDAEPRIWTSADGQTWTATRPRLGSAAVELRGLLRQSAGGLILIGRVPAVEGASWAARAWSSQDGEQWTAVELPGAMAGTTIDVASGPVGHLVSTGRELWYSADGLSWQRVHRTPAGVELLHPGAGDEGFVAPASDTEGDGLPIYASGDGVSWFEGEPPASFQGVTSWRGDWLGWAYTDNPLTISILSSSDGLEWAVDLDVNDLTPPDGPKAGQGLESGITEVTLAGEGGVVAMTLGWNHCCARPPAGAGVYTSTDAETWTTAGLPQNIYVTSLATDGEVVVMAGHFGRGRGVAFWVADR